MTATVPSQGLSSHQTKYEYDPLYQLTKATYPSVAPLNGEAHSWTYDAVGNRLTSNVNGITQTYSYQKIGINPLNWQRLLADGSNSYTYDSNGNTVTRNGPGGNFTFGWSADDRLAGISGTPTASYAYDHQGRRSSSTVGSAATYLYSGLNLIRESNGSADYLFGPGVDEPLAMSRGGQIYYYGTDALGSVSALTNSSGAVQDGYLYDAWGEIRSQTGSLASAFTYTAREGGEVGLAFYRARYYGPSVGRFLSEDAQVSWARPIRDPASGIQFGPPRSDRDPLKVLQRQRSFERRLAQWAHPRVSVPTPLATLYAYVDSKPILYTDTLGLDKPGCDGVPDCLETPPIRNCCDQHDDCYLAYGCTKRSWFVWSRWNSCTWCNSWGFLCVVGSAPFGPLYPVPQEAPRGEAPFLMN